MWIWRYSIGGCIHLQHFISLYSYKSCYNAFLLLSLPLCLVFHIFNCILRSISGSPISIKLWRAEKKSNQFPIDSMLFRYWKKKHFFILSGFLNHLIDFFFWIPVEQSHSVKCHDRSKHFNHSSKPNYDVIWNTWGTTNEERKKKLTLNVEHINTFDYVNEHGFFFLLSLLRMFRRNLKSHKVKNKKKNNTVRW